MKKVLKNSMKKATLISMAVTVALASTAVSAKISSDEAAKLTKELTAFGAERGANADGSIPEWTGGITSAPAGYTVGDHHPDPFTGDKILYTVTAKNVDQYKALFKSDVADIANCGSTPFGGSITAALYLKEFVEPATTPWLHFDVMAYNIRPLPGRPVGGEGLGLRATFEYLADRYK